MVANRVSLDQRFRRAGDCPICEGGDGMKRGQGVRCYGFEMARGNAVVCTQIASPHASGNGWVHVVDGPCDCGDDHASAYRPDPLPRRATSSDALAKITQAHKSRTPDAIHDYGAARLLRYGSGKEKRLCWQHFDRDYGWIDGLGSVAPGFYRAEQIASADARKPVYLAGGEKCVDALVAAGAVAGCNPGGEGPGKWRAEYGAILSGRHVVILADADETGRTHAQHVTQSLASVAASVRLLELEGAHDVADWLADGHTLLELLEITACTLPAQQSNPAMQDGRGPQSQKTGCPNCTRERELRQMAETSLANVRREQAMTSRILALPNEKMAAPVKLAAVAVRQILAQPKARDEEGMEQVYRAAIARQCGVSDQTASAHLRKLEKAGVVRREVKKSFDRTEIYIGEGDLFNAPEQIATPERANGWGGQRVKRCPVCHSDNLEIRITCRDCGEILSIDDVNKPGAQDDAQDTPPPLDTIVDNLAPDAGEIPSMNHHDERAALLALLGSPPLHWDRIPVGLEGNVGGSEARWRAWTAHADNALIDEALRSLRIRAEGKQAERRVS